MPEETSQSQINGRYECPADAGPNWRAAMDAGIDMSLLEESLAKSPWERIQANESALALIRMLEQVRTARHGATDQHS